MAVLRESQGMQAPGVRSAELQQSGAGAASQDVAKFLNKAETFNAIQGPGKITEVNQSGFQLLSTIFGDASKLAFKGADIAREEAYLRGIAAASTGQVEGEIESNMLTRSWATAGYRDTVGQLRIAESEAKIQRDMLTMREKSPAEFAKVLENRRKELLPSFDGMSRQARSTVFGQLATSDRAAIQQHGTEHSKFIVDTRTRTINSSIGTRATLMQAARGTPYYGDEVNAFLATTFSQTLGSDLPYEVSSKLMSQALSFTLSQGNLDVYNEASRSEVEFPDGTRGTILSRLPLPIQEQLGDAYRKGMTTLATEGGRQWHAAMGQMRADLDNPNVPFPTYEQYRQNIETGIDNGFMTVKESQAKFKEYWDAASKHSQSEFIAKAFFQGDTDAIGRSGNSMGEAAKLTSQYLVAQGMPTKERALAMLNLGANGGYAEAYNEVGAVVTAAVRNFGRAAEINETDLGIVQGVTTAMSAMSERGDSAALQNVLAGMPADARMFFAMYTENLRKDPNPQSAALATREQILEATAISPAVRQNTQLEQASENRKLADSLTTQGFFAWATPSFRAKSIASDTVRPLSFKTLGVWRSDPVQTQQELYKARSAVREELDMLSLTNPNMDAEARYNAAVGAVASRTYETEDGRVYLPRDLDADKFFGTNTSDSRGSIAQGMTEFAETQRKQPGDRVLFTVDPGGTMSAVRYNEDGVYVGRTQVDPKDIGATIRARHAKDAAKQDKLAGAGTTRQRKDPVSGEMAAVNFNGKSDGPVAPSVAYQFRQRLIDHEGIRNTVYKDGEPDKNGKQWYAFGIGINQKSGLWPEQYKEGDVVPQEVINETFAKASNAALRAGADTQAQFNLRGPEWTKLLAEMAYQGGPYSPKKPGYAAMFKGVADGDVKAAIAGLRDSNPWKYSKGDRRIQYEMSLERAMKGK